MSTADDLAHLRAMVTTLGSVVNELAGNLDALLAGFSPLVTGATDVTLAPLPETETPAVQLDAAGEAEVERRVQARLAAAEGTVATEQPADGTA